MQPVQDLTIEDRVSRTQYQFTRRGRRPGRAAPPGCRGWSSGCARCRSSPTSRATCRTRGLQAYVEIDRATAEPARHHAGGDRQRALQRLRPAAGVDDLHPDQPVPRGARGEARVPAGARDALEDIYVASVRPARRCRCARSRTVSREAGAARDQPHRASSRRRPSRSTSRPGVVARRRGRRDRRGAQGDRPAGQRADAASRARRSPSGPRSTTSCC